MFRELVRINERPPIFSVRTTAELWTDEHISEEMLRFHLDPTVDVSSRRAEFIDASASWIAETFRLGPGRRVLDLGCGPGLYTTRFARTGADVTGIDFSTRSIRHARETAEREGLGIRYLEADYLGWEPAQRFDLVTLIYLDFCPQPPENRLALLRTVERALAPGGSFLFDVAASAAMAGRLEAASYSSHPNGGFWSAAPHFEFANTFLYPDEAVTLERFVVVESDGTRTFCNWLQHFTPATLAAELAVAGLAIETLLGDVAGRPYDPAASEFAVVARRAE